MLRRPVLGSLSMPGLWRSIGDPNCSNYRRSAKCLPAADTARRSSADRLRSAGECFLWHVVSAHPHAIQDSVDGEIGRRQPQEQDVNPISALAQLRKPPREHAACECGFVCEADPLCGQFLQSGQHDPPGRKRHPLRLERREAARDRVRVHELGHAQCPLQQRGRGRGFARPVGTCKHNHAWRLAARRVPSSGVFHLAALITDARCFNMPTSTSLWHGRGGRSSDRERATGVEPATSSLGR